MGLIFDWVYKQNKKITVWNFIYVNVKIKAILTCFSAMCIIVKKQFFNTKSYDFLINFSFQIQAY